MDDELLAFPPENSVEQSVPPLNEKELITLRKMIAEYNQKNATLAKENVEVKPNANVSNLFQSEEIAPKPIASNSLFSDEPITPSNQVSSLFFSDEPVVSSEGSKSDFSELLDSCKNCDSNETEILNELKSIVFSTEANISKSLIVAILGLIPCKRFIRHGTPEQKLFVLKSLSDRFLENIAGLKFAERRRLLKIVSRYISDVSENYSFIAMEGEPFKPTFHERVAGSSSSGLVVKEMRSFLIVDSRTNRVIYTGLVLS